MIVYRFNLCSLFVLLQIAGMAHAAEQQDAAQGKRILGWVERVRVADVSVKAKLDTGAKTSSVDARDIEPFKRDGKRWVRFQLETRDDQLGRIAVERRVKRVIRVKEHDGQSQRRYTVELRYCIAGRRMKSEFSLVDRQRFLYPVLLGRSALKGKVVVDPERTFQGGADCEQEQERHEPADPAAVERSR